MADPEKRVHRNYPPLDFRCGCQCPACEIAVILWYTEDEHPARAEWMKYWDKVMTPTDLRDLQSWPCSWQIRRFREVEAAPKPTAYKIC